MIKTALVINDNLFMRCVIKELLESCEFNVLGEATNAKTAISMAKKLNPDLITLDNNLTDSLGINILKTLKKEGITSRIIMTSSIDQIEFIENVYKLGMDYYITKPNLDKEFISAIKETCFRLSN